MKIFKSRNVKTPTRGTDLSAGLDFYIPDDYEAVTLEPGEDVNVPSGIHVKLRSDQVLILFNKSGRAVKNKLIVGAQVIDADYQGEIHLHVFNAGSQATTIFPSEKLTQGIILYHFNEPVFTAKTLEELYGEATKRGTGGFGSTGL